MGFLVIIFLELSLKPTNNCKTACWIKSIKIHILDAQNFQSFKNQISNQSSGRFGRSPTTNSQRTNSRIESQSGSAQSSTEQGSRTGSTVTRSRNIESRESQNHNVEILTREIVLDSIKKSFGVFPDAGNNDQKDQRAQTSHSSVRKTQNKVLVNPGTKM